MIKAFIKMVSEEKYRKVKSLIFPTKISKSISSNRCRNMNHFGQPSRFCQVRCLCKINFTIWSWVAKQHKSRNRSRRIVVVRYVCRREIQNIGNTEIWIEKTKAKLCELCNCPKSWSQIYIKIGRLRVACKFS